MAKRLSFLAELKRRNVLRAVVLYIGAAWALAQGIAQLTPAIGLPTGATRWFLIACVIGFPLWVAFAWFYEFTPQGFRRESDVTEESPARHSTARRLDFAIIGVMALAIVLLGSGYFIRRNSPTAAAQPVPAKSLAVLPFVNLSGDPNEKYFSDGITEEILNALTQIPDLKVAGRTSAFQFNSKNEDPRRIGQTLGVANLLEGSVQKAGDEVRINVQLIDAHTGYQRWSEKYDRKLTNIFTIEDEIADAIAGKLRVQLAGGGQPLVRSATDDPAAHALYLQGVAKIAQRGPALKDAVALLEQATARAPNYAAAWAGLAQAYELLPWYHLGAWQPSLAEAEGAAQRALALEPKLGEAHAALANVLRDRLDFAGAIGEYRQALALNPGSSEIHNQYGQLLASIGQFEDAIRQERTAATLDPLAPDPRYILGFALLCMHRYNDAIAELKHAGKLTPDFTEGSFLLSLAHLRAGHYADAEKVARAMASQLAEDPADIESLMRAFADPTLRPDALKRVKDMHRLGVVELGGLTRAFWYSLLGAHEAAIQSLQQWVATAKPGNAYIGVFFLWMPTFDPLRNDPRFKAVLKKMGLPYTPAEPPAR